MKKKIISAILSVSMLFSALPIFAEEITVSENDTYIELLASDIASGTCGAEGSNISWKISSTGTLTISGSGEMNDYTYTGRPTWYEYHEGGTVKKIVISDGITKIGDYAFDLFYNVRSVSISDTVEEIGECAFSNMWRQESFELPSSLKSIGKSAFSNCSTSESITIPKNVEYIGRGIVRYTLVQSINVSADNMSYTSDDGVLMSKDKSVIYEYPMAKEDSDYTIPLSVTEIGEGAFYKTKVQRVKMSDNVLKIGQDAFSYCEDLCEINLSQNLTTLLGQAFSNCSSLEEIYIPNTLKTVPGSYYMFPNCNIEVVIDNFKGGIKNADYSFSKGTTSITYLRDIYIEPIEPQSYFGTKVTPEPVLKEVSSDGTVHRVLEKGKDYTVGYVKNNSVGTGTVCITYKGDYVRYSGDATTADFVIQEYNPQNSDDEIDVNELEARVKGAYKYTGKEQVPEIEVTYNYYDENSKTYYEYVLTEEADYTVYLSNNINAGKANVKISGVGVFKGTLNIVFTIAPKSCDEIQISEIKNYIFSGKEICPKITVKDLNIKERN